MTAWNRTRFCANLPASFLAYLRLRLLMQSSHIILGLPLNFSFQYSLFSCLFYINSKNVFKFPPNYGVQQPSCLLGLISDQGIRSSLSWQSTRKIAFVLERYDLLRDPLFLKCMAQYSQQYVAVGNLVPRSLFGEAEREVASSPSTLLTTMSTRDLGTR